jgi:glycine/D-amino acid oxidase-like deaminating enzyme
MPFRGNYHFDEGYYYFRDYEDRIIFGGGRNLDFEGETTTHFGENPAILDRLHALLREVVAPRQPVEVEGHWSGIMAFGPSKGPLVEQPYPHVVAGFRLGGMGVALGTTLGEILAERLTA